MSNRKKKIAIVGSGNAGCITALNYGFHGDDIFDIDLYHDPNVNIERVGQGTTVSVVQLISDALDIDWSNNPIKATLKSGIQYENWGKINHKFFHRFYMPTMSCHYVPNLLSKTVMESSYVNTIEKSINDPESEIDADFIFDCRGKHKNEYEMYDTIVNPLNSVVLSRKEGKDLELHYTRCVATPDGWTFVIPNHDSVSYGYLYNNTITSKEDATANFVDMFDVMPDGDLTFKNYIAKNMWQGERTILNGNRFSFIEPLEATSTAFYLRVAKVAWDHITEGLSKEVCNDLIQSESKKLQQFILWHYQNGSKFNTPFWDYAKQLAFNPDVAFQNHLKDAIDGSYLSINRSKYKEREYGIWPRYSFKVWYDNVAKGDTNEKYI